MERRRNKEQQQQMGQVSVWSIYGAIKFVQHYVGQVSVWGHNQGAHMEMGRKDILDQNQSPNQDLAPAHPADIGHRVHYTQLVSLPWRAGDRVYNSTGHVHTVRFFLRNRSVFAAAVPQLFSMQDSHHIFSKQFQQFSFSSKAGGYNERERSKDKDGHIASEIVSSVQTKITQDLMAKVRAMLAASKNMRTGAS
ncbi:unnamed protein product [Ranitomeya imitator]|uniref:Uncharacterized protein n=1 Tax=Ranitomeya imitator TaxID=111125 RepID=A0ABN9LKI6_9NEOB|nr:unnamed protein product [Ranitomeya imitator]